MDLVVGVKAWSDKVLTEVSVTHAEIAHDFFVGTIRDTPVKTGALKGNWIPSRGEPKFGTLKTTDKSGAQRIGLVRNTIGRMLANESSKRKSQSLNLTNSLPYANKAENTGWKVTPPYGMVKKNLRRTQNRIMARRLS